MTPYPETCGSRRLSPLPQGSIRVQTSDGWARVRAEHISHTWWDGGRTHLMSLDPPRSIQTPEPLSVIRQRLRTAMGGIQMAAPDRALAARRWCARHQVEPWTVSVSHEATTVIVAWDDWVRLELECRVADAEWYRGEASGLVVMARRRRNG